MHSRLFSPALPTADCTPDSTTQMHNGANSYSPMIAVRFHAVIASVGTSLYCKL